uniref:integrator complex subunit 10 isoform X2 n=1 Tax=Myxine glutinosa TaxID=7769 RepID=UPI00358F809F
MSEAELLVRKARELAPRDPCAAQAWLLTARSLFPACFAIQYEMYVIEKNSWKTAEAARLLYEMFLQFPDKPALWREVATVTAALRSDVQDKQMVFLRALFEALPPPVQCKLLSRAAERRGDALARAETVLLLLRRFPEVIPQHGVTLAESLLEGEKAEGHTSPINPYRRFFVCELLPLILARPDVYCLPNLLLKYLIRAAEFYIRYATRPPTAESGLESNSERKSPARVGGLRISTAEPATSAQGPLERSWTIPDPWHRLQDIIDALGSLDERWSSEGTTRMSPLQVSLGFFRHAFVYVQTLQPGLFAGSGPATQPSLVLVEDLSVVYSESENEWSRPTSKRRRLDESHDKSLSKEEEISRGRSISSPSSLPGAAEQLEGFRLAREAWDLLHSQAAYEKEFSSLCLQWKTDCWAWLRVFLVDMLIFQAQPSRALQFLQQQATPLAANAGSGSGVGEARRVLVQMAACQYALGEHTVACEHILELVSLLSLTGTDSLKPREEALKVQSKSRKGQKLMLLPCTDGALLHYGLHLLLACLKVRAFADGRSDLALGHVIVLLQYDWPRGDALFLRAVQHICQQGSFQYENFFNYVTKEFAFLRMPEGGRVNLELLPNQGLLVKQHTVTRGLSKGVKEDFRLAMERQVGRCSDALPVLLRRFLLNERVMLLQSLA